MSRIDALALALATLTVACGSEPPAEPPGPPPAEARAAGYKAWTANVEARRRATQAKRAAAEAEELGDPPALEELQRPIAGWLRVHLGEPELHVTVFAPAATRTVVEVDGDPQAAWSYDVAVSPHKGPWQLHRFALRGGKILTTSLVEPKDAEPRLKELLGVEY